MRRQTRRRARPTRPPGRRRQARGAAARGAAPQAASPDKSFRCGDIWKFISGPIEEIQRFAGKMKPRGGLRRAAVRPPARGGGRRLVVGGRGDGLLAPSGQRALHASMPADFPLDRAKAGGGRMSRGRSWRAPAGRTNGWSIADLLEFWNNFLRILFYRHPGSARDADRRAERELSTAGTLPPNAVARSAGSATDQKAKDRIVGDAHLTDT